MQLEELSAQWQSLDAKLQQSLQLQRELIRVAVAEPVRRRINRLAIWPVIDIVLSAVGLLFSGDFMYRHWGEWSLMLPAALLYMTALLLLGTSVWQLVIAAEIDWSGAVTEIQAALTKLRIAKIRQFKWAMLLGPLVFFCCLVVGLQFVVDRVSNDARILDKLNPWWVASNYLFGVLFVVFGHAVIRFLANRFGNQGWWQRALDDVSGTSMTEASAELERWRELDRHDG